MTDPAGTAAPHLSERHRHMLTVESGLSEATVAGRGYRTVRGPEGAAELVGLGFNLAQGRTAERGDVLLVPLYDITGAVVSHQIRPDAPRVSKGSPLKYETPAQRGNRVDFPPAGRELAADGTSPIWVTEGAKTADAIAQAGAGTLMLAGVWGFMGRTAAGIGTAVVSDLYGVPVEGRTVYLAYDSDVVTKESVQAAERRLAEILGSRGAAVLVVRIPAAEGGGKQGADDYLAAGGTLEELVATAQPPSSAGDPLGGRPPQVYAYGLAQEGQQVTLDPTGAFLLRPTDAEGHAVGPARRYSRDELRDRTLSLAGARGATTLPLSAATHAVSRLTGDHVDGRVPLAPAHVVRTPEATWVDMGTSIGHDVVRISADGWGYAPWSDVPHWILRDDQVCALAPPAPAGERSWEPLEKVVGLDPESFAVVRTWLVSVLVADRVPLLWWRGAAGSGKSTRAKLVGRVLGLPELVTAPRDKQDALSKLQTSPWLMAENLGKLDPSVSDLWCAAVTDGVIADRVLYTSRQLRITGRWTGQVTSITDVPGALDDLMSRALILDVPLADERTAAERLVARLDAGIAAVRGALFDDAAAVLARLLTGVASGSAYRFPAIATVAHVLDELAGADGLHLGALEDAGASGVAERSETDPWVQWIADQTRQRGGRWEATATEIFEAQREARRVVVLDRNDDELWPGSAKQVGWWLPARAGRLRERGVSWTKQRRGHDRTRIHVLTIRTNTDASPDVPDVVKIAKPRNVREETPGQTGCTDVAAVPDVSSLPTREGSTDTSEDVSSRTRIESPGPKTTAETAETSGQAPDQGFSPDVPPDVSLEAGQQRPGHCWRLDRLGAVISCTLDEARDGLIESVRAAGGTLTVDVETSGYPVGHHDFQLRTVQLGGAEIAWVFDVRDGAEPTRKLIRDFLAVTPRLHAHSATADLVPLAAAGLCDESAWTRMYDTVIPAKLADPGSTGADPGLKQLAEAVLGDSAVAPRADAERAALFKRAKWRTNVDPTTPVERSGWAQVDPAEPVMLRYAASDVLDTAALAAKLPELPVEVVERERAVQRVTARVAHRGLAIDGEHVQQLRERHLAQREQVAERVRAHQIDNPGSDKQIAARLLALGLNLPHTKPSTRHPNGQPSVAAGVLEKLRDTAGPAGELVAAVLDFRHHDTVLGTFLEPYRQLVQRGDGRARPTVYTLGTDTGRMSCVRPNLQQLPREGGVRACITADPGQFLVSADFSGVELRVAAALSGDANLRRMLANNEDLHWLIAREVWGPEATKANRYAAKRIVFGRLYGGGVPTLAAQAGVRENVAASAVDVLDSFTPGLSAWSRQLRDAARAGATQMPTYAGRTIHLSRDYPHKAPNYAIQGTARELLVDAIERWEQTRWAGSVVLPVHDEIVTAVPAEQAEQATAELVRCMTTELYGVAIVAEASQPSFAWQDAS